MIKAKFGERLRSKSKAAQTNEILCKILCHNVCCLIQSIYELGIEPTFWTEQSHRFMNLECKGLVEGKCA